MRKKFKEVIRGHYKQELQKGSVSKIRIYYKPYKKDTHVDFECVFFNHVYSTVA